MKELNLKEKKIVAREFLLFIICLAIATLTFLTFYPYNYVTQKQSNNYRTEINEKTKKIDSIIKNREPLDLTDANKILKKEIPPLPKGYVVIKKTDSVVSKNFVPPIDGVIVENNTTDSKQKSKLDSLTEEIRILEHKLKEKNNRYIKTETHLKIAGVAFLISFLILFILRYVYYGVKWSVGVLRIN